MIYIQHVWQLAVPKTDQSRLITPQELRDLAKAMGCKTQLELGNALGISQARVSQILTGAYPLKRGSLLELIRRLQAQHLRRDTR